MISNKQLNTVGEENAEDIARVTAIMAQAIDKILRYENLPPAAKVYIVEGVHMLALDDVLQLPDRQIRLRAWTKAALGAMTEYHDG